MHVVVRKGGNLNIFARVDDSDFGHPTDAASHHKRLPLIRPGEILGVVQPNLVGEITILEFVLKGSLHFLEAAEHSSDREGSRILKTFLSNAPGRLLEDFAHALPN